MPEIPVNLNLPIETLQLVFKNDGQPTTDPPVPLFRDIVLSPASQNALASVLAQAKQYDRPIRSDGEMNQVNVVRSELDSYQKELRRLEKHHRVPWVLILAQISGALEKVKTDITVASDKLRSRIESWRSIVIEGAKTESENLKAKAEGKRQEARYAENPQTAARAKEEAKRLEAEAKKVAPKPAKGIDTEEYFEFEINSRVLAAKLPPEAIEMTVNERWFRNAIKQKIQAGEAISPNSWPGVTFTKKTRVRFHS
jgi:hypothetical protein